MGPWAAVPGSTAGSPAPGRSRRCSPPPAPVRGAPARRTPPSPSGWIKGVERGGGNKQPPWQRESSSPWGRKRGVEGTVASFPHPQLPLCVPSGAAVCDGRARISLPRGSRGRVTGTAQGAGERGAPGRLRADGAGRAALPGFRRWQALFSSESGGGGGNLRVFNEGVQKG